MKNLILGFDEVGRGPLAGPVVVACVLSNEEIKIPKDIVIRDSKKMTARQKEKANIWIRENYIFGIGQVSANQIDQKGISNAVRLAAFLALKDIKSKSKLDFEKIKLLIDGRDEWIDGSQTIICGDDKINEISMASIIAKVYRDNLMIEIGKQYPVWGFEKHVGYGTAWHCHQIQKNGLIKNLHRTTFCHKLISKT
ncbi:ribonuclease HII [Candidatus Beckwithbacteria bacterium CG23_combo_of_CG06-09_8_20_14_all_34_8]|uniref:Ribonuclease n=1 Tax=Candidatus Beckwithbacteria bacterium CG23_combo_of_CG06-09_8_20_14_all_34_8 TaxID=1974497 RepID=A0A2H0B7A9_9BACT|nr:MAG: ribonuclease HII [Candidatus Beckwithbacteria bacterium CG23_combo_of_CG06-09_8_20_14_all_34_8]